MTISLVVGLLLGLGILLLGFYNPGKKKSNARYKLNIVNKNKEITDTYFVTSFSIQKCKVLKRTDVSFKDLHDERCSLSFPLDEAEVVVIQIRQEGEDLA